MRDCAISITLIRTYLDGDLVFSFVSRLSRLSPAWARARAGTVVFFGGREAGGAAAKDKSSRVLAGREEVDVASRGGEAALPLSPSQTIGTAGQPII